MKIKLPTVLGDFTLITDYKPLPNDRRLNRLISVINKSAVYPIIIVSKVHPNLDLKKDTDKIIELSLHFIRQSELENDLYESTKIFGNEGLRISLNLKKKEINASEF